MNADSLIGKVLGTCTLQKIIGQGGMGAVYLAQQSRPRRQVAVKVLLPTTTLTAHQRAAFLERFRRETDAAASLEHPNILHVHEYGERDGLAYLVMPYISGGTIRDLLEQEEQLPLAKALNYLEQLASALDFAHEHGVIHRDIKPANILLTAEGRLLLTDFGLVKIIADGQTPQMRLTGAGAPVGTPDYMAPEQVLGEVVDGRSDLYSLGVILYQMLTGLTPFQGETPMQIAAQQLQTPPPSPRLLRKDLPLAAEQVLLKAMAKRPADRYSTGSEFATAFRNALVFSGIPVGGNTATSIPIIDTGTSGRLFTPRGLFDPGWQTGTLANPLQGNSQLAESAKQTGALPSMNSEGTRSGGLLSRTGMFPKATGVLPALTGSQPVVPAKLPTATGALPTATNAQPGIMPIGLSQESPVRNTTGALQVPANAEQNAASTMKLTGPVKVVQMPVAGQPGQYVTGLLPVIPQTPVQETLEIAPKGRATWQKIAMAVLALLLISGIASSYLYIRGHGGQSAHSTSRTGSTATAGKGTPDLKATATANALANIIITDPLSQNIHNFPIGKNEFFTGNAYHISNTDGNAVAVMLPGQVFTIPISYSLTMWEIKGDNTSNNNSFGMIIRFSQQKIGTKTITTFYSFETVDINGGEYRFYKYNDSQGSPTTDWTELWHAPFGHEYHQGLGPKTANTISIFQSGATFIFTINGKQVGNVHDATLKSGMVGMLVNLKGTEVAFTNMLITK